MSLEAFAENELRIAGMFDKDSDYGGMLGEAVMKLIKVFAIEGHSGLSASMAVSIFEKVARFEPLTPLTGADDEWVEYAEGRFQNCRCSHVFKDADGIYDAEGRIFEDPDGSRWTNGESRVPITFPYIPSREIVKREAA